MKKIGKYSVFIIVVMVVLTLFLKIMLDDNHKKEKLNEEYALEENNKLIVYSSHKEEVYAPIIKEFEERTGIWVQVITGGTNELLEKIALENGKNSADVMFGGGVDSLNAYSDYFMSYEANQCDQLSTTYRSKDNKWTAFSKLPIVFVYNNKLVYSAGTPRSWKELLDYRWQGEIAFANPSNSGTSYTALASMIEILQGEENAENLIAVFKSNVGKDILENSGSVLDEVISGDKLVGITLEEAALKKMATGADIGMIYPIEGTTAVPDGTAIIKQAPHKENAELFLDFTVSEDVQRLLIDKCYRRSVREDMDDEEVIEEVPYNLEWASKEQNKILAYWNENVQ